MVSVCTAIWLRSGENQQLNKAIERLILEASLSDDIYRMPILMDLWTLYLRYDCYLLLFKI